MDVPTTVSTALEDRPVSGAVCLEAGAGVGNTTAGLLAAGASRVYAVTNDAAHAKAVSERVARAEPDRTAVLEADLRSLPLADDSVEIITAHGLFNVLPPESLDAVVGEFRRVASPGCHLVVDDYEPLPSDAAIRELFALENATSELARGRPALTFYPADVVRRLFVGDGWTFDREWTLLDPVPWTENHVRAHANVARSFASKLPDELGDQLAADADRLETAIGSESVGEMYSIAFQYPE
ncbi:MULTISPECIES: class I SAM-dependent methyltransferase [Haloferax]|uniref:Methyltransferase domain-containing protein n=1 Tax=Haloferax marinum TaxID=2666143 RepID=A0A6A8GB55_9EURY|nr:MULTISPECIES: class I SAM-dependent methyltransferase [Haloferax]KAB1198702.1 class I SAM-dependent methyltransferase [Haloferax sp. CBA1150]MRW97818.1 methyltransferase domain-containing protein [Haloferax marinum]